MNPGVVAPQPLVVLISPTRRDLVRYGRLAMRRTVIILVVLGLLLSLGGAAAVALGGRGSIVAGVLTGVLGISLLLGALRLPGRVARRLPSALREPRTCEIDRNGIRLRGTNWANEYAWAGFRRARLAKHFVLLDREPGAGGLALPRSAFAADQESQLIVILKESGLLPHRSR